jgi:hypothetical protein
VIALTIVVLWDRNPRGYLLIVVLIGRCRNAGMVASEESRKPFISFRIQFGEHGLDRFPWAILIRTLLSAGTRFGLGDNLHRGAGNSWGRSIDIRSRALDIVIINCLCPSAPRSAAPQCHGHVLEKGIDDPPILRWWGFTLLGTCGTGASQLSG